MKTAVKLLAVLFVGLPLWFLAWRGYEEWRIESAWAEHRELMRLQWKYATGGEPPDAKRVYDRTKYLSDTFGDAWTIRRLPASTPEGVKSDPWRQ